VVKVLQKLRPDLLIVRHTNMAVIGAKLGIPTIQDGDVNISAGYDGLIKLGERLLTAWRTRRIFHNIAKHYRHPYTKWWAEQDDPYLLSRQPVH